MSLGMRRIGLGVLALSLLTLVSGCVVWDTVLYKKENRPKRYRVSKLARSANLADRDTAATILLRKRKYEQAAIVLEDLLTLYRTTSRAQEIMWLYAETRFKQRDYISAGHYYQQLVDQYPYGKNAEEALYKVALCHDRMSNASEYDQTETAKALESYQLYVSVYPDTKRLTDVNQSVQKLRGRLAEKAYTNAYLYYKLGYHKAAVVAFKTMLNDFPDSPYREEAQFTLFKSQVEYANQSIETKQKERYEECLGYYLRFAEKYPNSRRNREARQLFESVERNLTRLRENQTAAVR